MWQFVVVAAVAGCGLYAKRLLRNVDPVKIYVSHQSDRSAQEKNGIVVERKVEKEPVDSEKLKVLISPTSVSSRVPSGISEISDPMSNKRQNLVVEEEGIFRFSSLDIGNGSESRLNSKCFMKKVGSRKIMDSLNKRRISVEKIDKKSNVMEGEELVIDEQREKGRKFFVCLKRRRTSKNSFRKSGSCSSKGDLIFSWGLGLGVMYMVSAGKAEINKLNEAIEETTKVVNNLKSELRKRKLPRNLENLGCKNGIDGHPKETVDNEKQLSLSNTNKDGTIPDDVKILDHLSTDERECASSIPMIQIQPA